MFNAVENGTRIRSERKRLGLNQTDFAQLGGVGLQSQSRYENGSHLPNLEYLAGVAEGGADVLYIVTGIRAGTEGLGQGATRLLAVYLALPAQMQDLLITFGESMRDKFASLTSDSDTDSGASDDR